MYCSFAIDISRNAFKNMRHQKYFDYKCHYVLFIVLLILPTCNSANIPKTLSKEVVVRHKETPVMLTWSMLSFNFINLVRKALPIMKAETVLTLGIPSPE